MQVCLWDGARDSARTVPETRCRHACMVTQATHMAVNVAEERDATSALKRRDQRAQVEYRRVAVGVTVVPVPIHVPAP